MVFRNTFVGSEAVEAGLADGLAEVRRELRERYGEDVNLKPFTTQKTSLVSRLMGGAMVHVFDELDARSLWARFGL